MRLINVLAATLIGVTVILVQPHNTAALDGGEVNNIAKQITVKIDGQNQGTGIIVKKEGNTYTVLTNHHVVRDKGKYILITPNGKTYNFNSSDIRKLPNLDLAVVQFASNDNYTIATLGDSNKLTESTPIYNAGWSVNDSRCLKGCYRFYNGIINGISPNPKEGYALIISNNTLPGMSGGPILNTQGELIGINGQSFKNGINGAVDFDGIPINKYKPYQNFLSVATKNNSQSVSTVSSQRETLNQPSSQSFENYIWPAKGVLTSGYGWRWGNMHLGIDIANSTGTPIYAAAKGIVERAGWHDGGYGNVVDIRHPDGSLTRYGQNSRILVAIGQKVKQGQMIAAMGNTGFATGPHLHFEVHVPNGVATNPMAYLPARRE